MGDRALVIFKKDKEYSPTVYLHWNGAEVPNWLSELKVLMDDRTNDLEYAAARFVGICHSHITGTNLSLGIWNTDPNDVCTPDAAADYSHGDAGVIICDCKDFSWVAYGGYLENYTKEKS